MTIEQSNVYEEWTAQCDRCLLSEDFGDIKHFQDLIRELKWAGWKIVRTKFGWEHICPECQHKEFLGKR